MSIRSVFLILAAGVIVFAAAFVLVQDQRTLKQRFMDHEIAAKPGIAHIAAAECAYDRVSSKHGERAILHYLRVQERRKKGEAIKRSDPTVKLGFLLPPALTACAKTPLVDTYMATAAVYRHPFKLGACNTNQRKGEIEDFYLVRCEITNITNLPVKVLDGDIQFKNKTTGETLFVIDLKIGLQFPPKGSVYGRANFKLTPERVKKFNIEKGRALSAKISLRIRRISLGGDKVIAYEN